MNKKKIFVGGMLMEVNSFNPVLSGRETFRTWLEGDKLYTMRGTAMELGGVFDCFDAADDVEVIPGFFAQACTSGPMDNSEFQIMAEHLFDTLRAAGKVDGVLLVMHGALASTAVDDCEGFLTEGVRKIVGKEIPVCASLDFHALFTRQMLKNLSSVSGYQTYPHVDHRETGRRAAEQLLRLLRGDSKTHKIYHEIPLIMSCENSNTIDTPMAAVMRRVQALLVTEGVVGGSIFLTQPWLDAKELNCSICMFVDDEQEFSRVDAEAKKIIESVWDQREKFYPPMPNIKEALEKCRAMPKPVMFVDYGDVPNAGGGGDGVAVLKELLSANLSETSCFVVADPKSAMQAVSVGVGAKTLFMIGNTDEPNRYNTRIPVEAEVLALSDKPIVHLGPAMKGYISQPGHRALLRCGSIYIILCENVCISHDQAMLRTMGLDPTKIDIIIMRATHSFMSCYADVMGSWLYVDTPGYSTRNLKWLPFAKCRRPIYPLDENCAINAFKGE